MKTLTGHFDGRVIVLDEPPGLHVNQRLIIHVESAEPSTTPSGTPGAALARFAGTISKEDADEMVRAIDDGCEQVDPDEW